MYGTALPYTHMNSAVWHTWHTPCHAAREKRWPVPHFSLPTCRLQRGFDSIKATFGPHVRYAYQWVWRLFPSETRSVLEVFVKPNRNNACCRLESSAVYHSCPLPTGNTAFRLADENTVSVARTDPIFALHVTYRRCNTERGYAPRDRLVGKKKKSLWPSGVCLVEK
jgi:hypothetical protein